MKILINIPALAITRSTIYVTILIIANTAILLPWSVVCFLRFYELLIPIPEIRVPLNFNYQVLSHKPFVVVDFRELFGNTDTGINPEVEYDLTLNIDGYCSNPNGRPQMISRKVSIMNEWEVRKLVALREEANDDGNWPISGNLALSKAIQYQQSQLLVITKSNFFQEFSNIRSFMLHCDAQVLYAMNHQWVPLAFAPFLPGYFQSRDRTANHLQLLLLKSFVFKNFLLQRSRGDHHQLVVEFASNDEGINIETAELLFQVNWTGIRYFLYHYRLTSAAVFIPIFWSFSSLGCLLVVLFIWFRFAPSETSQQNHTEKPELTPQPEGDLELELR
ncbi:hypothetical protein BABINDRAFT_159405 [Babjeviella inositovora NRRL Y-12698]|uniref:Seipin n=1 Tax=Babjeviella inositovora NRRL Y-12698 TaxID=984486 RepID=A0A1E3QZ65_9ASCO|nr:uncharacterized protein BABINDRAFT_159405 [Babjeviella inositovora NRRL Y-12698]ODQ82915.1 hypothetical protein BABINDRAFT_159405 [Babjeviella inositovora NRRL Y-12698]